VLARARSPLQLLLRTVNAARSAYACYIYNENFFQEYEAPNLPWAPTNATTQRSQASGTEGGDAIRCKAVSKVRGAGAVSAALTARLRDSFGTADGC